MKVHIQVITDMYFLINFPIEVDNKLYVLVNKLGGLTNTDIKKFIENTK